MASNRLWHALLPTLAGVAIGCGGTPTQPVVPVVASVVVSPVADTLTALGQTRQLTAVAKDASGNPISGKTFTWQSSAPTVLSVDPASGLATAVANGQATITASVDGKSGQAALTVAQDIATVTVTPGSAGLTSLGATQQFSAAAKDANGNAVAGVRFLWVSSDQSVATVDSAGLATAKGPGATTVTAAGRGVPGSAALSVTQAATKLAFSVQPANAIAGQALSSAPQVEIRDAGGNRVVAARDAVTLALGVNPGSGTLAGTKTVNAVAGIATFTGLSIDKPGSGYTLVASSGTLSSATSSGFNISSGLPELIAFQSTRQGSQYDIYVMDPTGGQIANLTNNAASDQGPAWSPDGSKLAFSSDRDGNVEIYVMNADGTYQVNVTNNAASDNQPAWSPDGKKIAYVTDRGGNPEIYVMNADGTNPVNITNNSASDQLPTWSPDGSKIAFQTNRDGNLEIYVMNADGTGPTRLTNNVADDAQPSWSPDGSKIVFTTNRDGNNEIYVMNADGTGATNLTNNGADDVQASWSRDGSKIYFVSIRDANWEIYSMNANGSSPTRLTNTIVNDFGPRGRP